jgi:tetratricopeptide (TPR) repeat protein
VAGRTWKDDLPSLILALAAQLGMVRAVDWARANTATQEVARSLVENRFYFLPQIGSLLVVFLFARLVVNVLNLRGVSIGDWLRSSALLLILGLGCLVVSHLDQILFAAAELTGASVLKSTAQDVAASGFSQLLARTATLRFAIDLAGLLCCLLAIRLGKPSVGDAQLARGYASSKDWVRSGDAYLKAGDVRRARRMFKKGRAFSRLAALEMRDGDPAEAARLYQDAGDGYLWEASRAWLAAGKNAAAEETGLKALHLARTSGRWDRLAEIAEALGDNGTLAEACRKLAEGTTSGPVRSALWKRAGEAYRAAGRPGDAAEAFRSAQEYTLAGELFVESGRASEAVQSFEKSGALTKAALAAARAGDEKTAQELLAREAEARGDLVSAAEAWRRAGQPLRAAGFYEKAGDFVKAGDSWRDAGRPERAAALYQKGGAMAEAAASFEATAQNEKAATLYMELKQYGKAAALFRAAGRLPAAAAALQADHQYDEAAQLFHRTGRSLEAARCALHGGHREKAWEYLTSVPRNDEGLAEAFHDLARAHLAAGETEDAIHVLREFLPRGPVESDNLPLHMTLLKALRAAGDPGEGVELGRIAAFDPSVLEGSSTLPEMPFGEVETDASMPAALIRTPAVHKSGPYAAVTRSPVTQQVQPPRLTIPVGTAAPAAPLAAAAPTPPPPQMPPAAGAPAFRTGSGLPETPEERYEILSELGRGGMGVVHKALDRKLDRFVAVKILPWQLRGDETAMRYFKREAKAIAALKHPNIVALYDYGDGFGSLYLAMEYLEGPNLQKLIKKDPERVRKNWRSWFVQATRGVAAAHAKGILHRDLKPANLILDEHGTLRILDFGLALPQADAGGTSKLIGSPAFFPPEVLRGEMPSPASDVYSLGAAFYTLATGRWPYVGDDVLVARLERDPDDPRPYAPFLNEEEVTILMKTLARHRPDRYPDGGELLAALLSLEAV